MIEYRAEETKGAQSTELFNKKHVEDLKERGETYTGLGLGAAAAAWETFGGTLGDVNDELLALSIAFPEASKTILTTFAGLPAQMDTAMAKIPKALGFIGQETRELIAVAQDIAVFSEIGSPAQLARLEALGGLIRDIAVSPDDIATAAQSAYQNIEAFRPSLVESDRALAAYLTNRMAGYEKLGVKGETFGKLVNQQVTVFGEGLEGAVRNIDRVSSVADSLEISQTRAMTNMSTNMNVFAQYGNEQVEIYAKMEAQAQATGMAVNELAAYAEGLDTFEGAANAAQGLNAVMGDTYMNFEELAVASHPDKIKLIQEAWARTGKEFENLDRHAKKSCYVSPADE